VLTDDLRGSPQLPCHRQSACVVDCPEAGDWSPASAVDRDYASGLVSSLVISVVVRRSTGWGHTGGQFRLRLSGYKARLNAAAVAHAWPEASTGSRGGPRCSTLVSDRLTTAPYFRYSPFFPAASLHSRHLRRVVRQFARDRRLRAHPADEGGRTGLPPVRPAQHCEDVPSAHP
jgi:hypothetical protein